MAGAEEAVDFAMNRKVRIAVDQTVNLDISLLNQLQIINLPIHITNLPDEMEDALKNQDLVSFYRLLESYNKNPPPATKAGSPFEIKEILERAIISENCDIICFVVGRHLSAIYNNTLYAAQELMRIYTSRIAVIGEQAFLSLEILAERTAELVRMGKEFDEVLNFIEQHRHRIFVLGTVLDIRRLRRTGRVLIPNLFTNVLQACFKLFGVLPFFILESERPRLQSLVARRNITRFILRAIEARVGFKEPLIIKISYTGSDVPADALYIKSILTKQSNFKIAKPIEVNPASPVIGIHTGPALVAVGVMGLGYDAITTEILIKVFLEAQIELSTLRTVVNAINVFPVQDGDTGTNLLSPLIGVTSNIDPNLPLSEALNQIVMRIAHRGGGYSGGALAAFFLGFNSCVREQETSSELHLDTFVTALEKGVDQCYRYFGDDAKEGTILSVMRACSLAAKQAFEDHPTFRNVLIRAYFAATDELLNPRLQEVEILRKQKLVDAGGFGFTLFLWAVLRTLGLHREQQIYDRYQYVLHEVRSQAYHGQRLIYRRQPESLRGYCIEGCVNGQVVEELRAEFLKLDNRLPNPKMTFNVVDNTTHFHIHVSEGLEEQVLRIASRYGYVIPPRSPTRLAKRRGEIFQFRLINFFSNISRLTSTLATFFGNWFLYIIFFPIMWERYQQRLKKLLREFEYSRLISMAMDFLVQSESWQTSVIDADLTVVFLSGKHRGNRPLALEQVFPWDVAQELRSRLIQMSEQQRLLIRFEYNGYRFEGVLLASTERVGYLLRYYQERV